MSPIFSTELISLIIIIISFRKPEVWCNRFKKEVGKVILEIRVDILQIKRIHNDLREISDQTSNKSHKSKYQTPQEVFDELHKNFIAVFPVLRKKVESDAEAIR